MQKAPDSGAKTGMLERVMLLGLAVFMGALAVGLFTAPMDMAPVLALELKGFIAFTFGGIAAGSLVGAFGAPRGAAGEVPPEVLERCFTCGEPGPGEVECPHCGEPPFDRALAVQVTSAPILGDAIVASILAGLFCLGGFVMLGPFIDGERRVWALIAFFGLGLLLMGLGSIGILGFAIALKEKLRGVRTVAFGSGNAHRFAEGAGRMARGELVWLAGRGEVEVPLTSDASDGEVASTPEAEALAVAIATFVASGFLALESHVTYEWQLGDPSAKRPEARPQFQRETTRQVLVLPLLDREELDSHGGGEKDVQRFIRTHVQGPQRLRGLVDRLLADPVQRAQFEQHATTIRERGVVVADDLTHATLVAMKSQ